jgi:hypothetical protein
VPFLKEFEVEFRDKARFLTVYIEEAHAQDEWPIGSRLIYNQPKQMEERLNIIQDFKKELDYSLPICADLVGVQGEPDNQFEKEFAAWPIRLYVVVYRDGKFLMEHIAEPVLGTFGLAEIRQVLEKC